ncbi:hypothetical protein AGMMS49532_00400 [Endomicrobiia bacterium]|nr:hypothetical protein AGMMS49532_00400 [Endomicrobiia bacterium]
MKIRKAVSKAVSVVLMLLFLVSYSNALGIDLCDLCKRQKAKLNQCKTDLATTKTNCDKSLGDQTAKTTECRESLSFSEGLNKGLQIGMGIGGAAVVVVAIGSTCLIFHN